MFTNRWHWRRSRDFPACSSWRYDHTVHRLPTPHAPKDNSARKGEDETSISEHLHCQYRRLHVAPLIGVDLHCISLRFHIAKSSYFSAAVLRLKSPTWRREEDVALRLDVHFLHDNRHRKALRGTKMGVGVIKRSAAIYLSLDMARTIAPLTFPRFCSQRTKAYCDIGTFIGTQTWTKTDNVCFSRPLVTCTSETYYLMTDTNTLCLLGQCEAILH